MAIGPGGVLLWDRLIRNYPVTPLPGYGDLKAYFNIDNGSGKVRGIYAEGNAAAVPMLRDWLDANLQGIVERLVRREVERIARRAELS